MLRSRSVLPSAHPFAARALVATLLALVLLVASASAASAATLYVATTGSDDGNCMLAPCATLAYADGQASPGDTVELAAGDYDPGDYELITSGVTYSGPVGGGEARLIMPEGTYGVRLTGDDITLQHLTITTASGERGNDLYGLTIDGSDAVIHDVVMSHLSQAVALSHGLTVTDSTFFDIAGNAMGGDGPIVATNNDIDVDGGGIYLQHEATVTATGNTFRGTGTGLYFDNSSPGGTITGNRFASSLDAGIVGVPGVDAPNNWWGCNAGANEDGCVSVDVFGSVEPHLVLRAHAAAGSIPSGGTTTITASLATNSADENVSDLFAGTPVAFASDLGDLDPTSVPLDTDGHAVSTLTAPSEPADVNVTASLDSETVTVPVTVTAAAKPDPVIDEHAAGAGGTTITITGTGAPGSSIVLTDASTSSGSTTVEEDGTWSIQVQLDDYYNNWFTVRQDDEQDSNEISVYGVPAPCTAGTPEGDTVQDITVTGCGEPDAVIHVYDTDGTTLLATGTADEWGDYSIPLTLTFGPHTLHVSQHSQDVESLPATVDVTAHPAAPTLRTPTDGATVEAGLVHFKGSAVPSARITIVDSLAGTVATGRANSRGRFDIVASLSPDTGYSLSITQRVHGYDSLTGLPISVYSQYPAATIDLQDPFGGYAAGDTITLVGTGYANETLTLHVESDTPSPFDGESITVGPNGAWSQDIVVPEGISYLWVEQFDGDSSPSIYLDPIAGPQIEAPYDDSTVRPRFSVSGYGFPGDEVTVKDENGTTLGTATPDACGCWSIVETTTPLSNGGPHTLTAVQTHNGSERTSDPVSVTVDENALDVHLADGGYFSDSSVHLTGGGVPGYTLNLYADPSDESPFDTALVGDDGTIDLTTHLAPGPYVIYVTQSPDGDDSESTDGVFVPVVVFLATPTVDPPSVTAAADGDLVTLTGTATPGATVYVYDNDDRAVDAAGDEVEVVAVPGTEPDSGTWTASVVANAGDNAYFVVQENSAFGSRPSDPVHVFGIADPKVDEPQDDGHVGKTFHVTGTGDAGATVHVLADGTEFGSGPVVDGAFDVENAAPLDYGPHELTIYQTVDGVDGNTVTLDVTAGPPAPIVDPVADGPNPLTFAGTAVEGLTVEISEDGDPIPGLSTVIDESGTFSLVPADPLAYGVHHLTAIAYDGDAPSAPVAFSAHVVLPTPTIELRSATTVPAGEDVVVGGHGEADSTVELVVNGDEEAQGPVDGDGDWQIRYPARPGTNTIQARDTDGSNPSALTDAVTVTGVGAPEITSPTEDASVWPTFTLSGTAMPGATVAIEVDDGPLDDVVADDEGEWSTSVTIATMGPHAIQVSQTVEGVTGPTGTRHVEVVLPVLPSFTAQPESQSIRVGATVTFTAPNTGEPDPTMQWQRSDDGESWTDVDGETSDRLSFAVALADDGAWFRLVATNLAGSVTSDPATLTVFDPGPVPTVVTAPAAITSAASPPVVGIKVSSGKSKWANAPTSYVYSWQRCQDDDCDTIPGAVARSYLPSGADVGYGLRYTVVARNAAGDSSPASSPVTARVELAAPTNLSLPVVATSTATPPELGIKVSVGKSSWSGAPTSYAYAWSRCDRVDVDDCEAIDGQTARSYYPVAADVGLVLRYSVVASNAIGDSAPAISPPTDPVIVGVPQIVSGPAAPTMPTATPDVGTKITRGKSTWTGSPTSFAYQWYRCDTSGESCTAVAGKVSSDYVVKAADVGHTLRFTVAATNDAGTSAPVRSPATDVVP